MADELDLTEILRRAVQANVKFYQGWLDLSLDYVRGISDIFVASGGSSVSVDSLGESAEAGVLVLEGEDGTSAQGAFLVTNDLSRRVSCRLVASQFTDSDGKVVRPKVTFEPRTFELQPGEQRVVQASLVVGRTLVAGYGYQGTFAIEGMEGISVPVVLRRRHRADDMPESSMEQAEADGDAAAGGPAARKTAERKARAREKATTAKTAAKKTAPRKRVARQKG
ncbi:MAG: hypothetical protein Q8N53_08715 [Longimicrobiales bacterium]|nr:hypothetical protein [Longimicrobiales bacterium]